MTTTATQTPAPPGRQAVVVPRRPGSGAATDRDERASATPQAAVDRRDHPPSPSIGTARAALVYARRYRAEHLVAVAEGLLSPWDVIAQAATAEGKPLRRITLRQLLLSQPGWGPGRTDRILSGLAARIGTDSDEVPTVAWLLDPRSGGRRLYAWLDVHQEIKDPWPGYPFTAYGEARR